jgi:hypothetical protein
VTSRFGETVLALALVPFPFMATDRAKQRPDLVILPAALNTANGQVIPAMNMSAHPAIWDGDIPLRDIEAAGLRPARQLCSSRYLTRQQIDPSFPRVHSCQKK